jgi:hypothetical protein
MEILNQIWVWVVAVFGFIAGSGIVGVIIAFLPKLLANIVVKKIDIKKEQEKGFNEGVAQVKKVTFKHSIQPVVESELVKVTEKVDERIIKQNKEIKEQYNRIINVLDKFMAYFENSMVSDEKKAELREALKEAKIPVVINEVVESGEVIIEDKKEADNSKNKDETKIIR